MWLAWAVGALAILYLALAFIGLVPDWNTCLTATLAKIDDRQGYDFLIKEINCDMIEKSDHVLVYVAKTGEGRGDVIFEYDPADQDIPSVTVDVNGNIWISIPRVNEVFVQKTEWKGHSISYTIDKIFYQRSHSMKKP